MTTTNPRYHAVTSTDIVGNEEVHDTTVINNLTPETCNTTAEPIDLPPPYDPGEGVPPILTAEDYNESPPLYSDVVKLPTYNESENIISDGEDEEELHNRSILYYFLRNDTDAPEETNSEQIGTDIGFIFCFLITFIFNGIGFIVTYCTTNTLSSHYGAVSGFGLSLVKWAFVAKHSSYSKEYVEGSEWILYILILLGWMIFLRGMFSYVQLKRYVYSHYGGDRPREIE